MEGGLQVHPSGVVLARLVMCHGTWCLGLLPDFLSDPNSLSIQFHSLVSFGSTR